MASWDDENYDLDGGFVNKLDQDSKIVLPDQELQNKQEKNREQKETEAKRELAEVEDFMGSGPPTEVVNSKPVLPQPTPVNVRAEFKASLREASTIDDFMRISSDISDIINSARESEHYVKLLVEIIRKCAKDLPPDDIKHLSANLNSLHKTQDKKKKGKRPGLKLTPGKKGDASVYDEFNLEDNPQDSGDEQYYKKNATYD
eukprot:TRINITY_DN92_c0_g1_i2.p1 TRINITY_DN92_c0_g1~~TRINITY_DN92_c0_g1_i2.p1  ORF type:complete len:202 (-),score=51.52 TRINITY_DN92_c0_g1_i2:250-855(-)